MSNEEKQSLNDESIKVEEKEAIPSNNNTTAAKDVNIEDTDKNVPKADAVMTTLELKVDGVLKQECNKEKPDGDPISFKVVYNKTRYDIEFPTEGTVKQLKEHLSPIINVLPTMQKVMIKGLAKDEKTLRELGVTKGAKLMVVGSTLNDVVSVNAPKPETSKVEGATSISSGKEPYSKQKNHRKILDKGLPKELLPGLKNVKEPLPPHPLTGMVNQKGGKVRLTFKLELDQIWLGTKERTEKINMSSIQQIVSEKIEGHEEYNMVALQLGPTEASRYWIYWVPSQYVKAIKETVLGKWQ